MLPTFVGPVRAAPAVTGGFEKTETYTPGLFHMIEYSIAGAGLALLAGFVYSVMSAHEVGAKYRTAVNASAMLQLIAAVTYLALYLSFHNGFVFQAGAFVPAPDAQFSPGLRYADWSVTVPLLSIELLAVCTLVGQQLSRARAIAVVASFGMIITGFFGAEVFSDGNSTFWLNVWAVVSTVFFLVIYGVLGAAVARSRKEMSATASTSLVNATVLLFTMFGVYPLLYLVQVLVGPTSNVVVWAVVVQAGFSFTDVIAKVGFGALIHKVAKLRTAEDVNDGAETHPEPVWISNELYAEAWSPLEAMLADGSRRGTRVHDAHAAALSSPGNGSPASGSAGNGAPGTGPVPGALGNDGL